MGVESGVAAVSPVVVVVDVREGLDCEEISGLGRGSGLGLSDGVGLREGDGWRLRFGVGLSRGLGVVGEGSGRGLGERLEYGPGAGLGDEPSGGLRPGLARDWGGRGPGFGLGVGLGSGLGGVEAEDVLFTVDLAVMEGTTLSVVLLPASSASTCAG